MKLSWLVSPSLVAAAACTTTTVTVKVDPQPGWDGSAEVLVHSPQGALESRAPIASSLVVTIDNGDTVTVVLESDGVTQLQSNLDVQEGDLVEVPLYALGNTALIPINVSVPPMPAATTWVLSVPDDFGSASAPIIAEVPSGATDTPIFITASDATAALAMYGSTSAAIAGSAIALQTSLPFQAVTVESDAAPAGAVAGSLSSGGSFLIAGEQLESAAVGSDVIEPQGIGEHFDINESVLIQSDDENTTESASAGSVSAAIPTGPVVVAISTADIAQPVALAVGDNLGGAQWSLAGTADGGDYLAVNLYASTDANYQWLVMAPPGTTYFQYLELPADLTAPSFDTLDVSTVRDSSLDGYASSLHAFSVPDGASYEDRDSFMTPATTTARSSSPDGDAATHAPARSTRDRAGLARRRHITACRAASSGGDRSRSR
jgi:hypothetical protein